MTLLRLLPLTAAVAALAAAGCGSDGADAPGTNDAAQQSATAPQTTTPIPTAAATTPPATTTQAATAPAAAKIAATLSEWAIKPVPAAGTAGKVTFTVKNVGKLPHELVVVQTDKKGADLGPKGASRVPEKVNVGETGDVAVGQTKTFSAKLKAGHYVLLCNLPGHWAAGMYTDFNVQ